MTPLLIALAIAHFSSGLSSETLCETEMICAPSSTAWLMRLAKVLSRPPSELHVPFDVVDAVDDW